MQITKLLNDKEIKHGLLLVEKYPKPINKNNVVNTNSALLQFYSGNDGAGRKFYQYMNPERLQAILFMIVNNTSEKDDVKANAATMFRNSSKVEWCLLSVLWPQVFFLRLFCYHSTPCFIAYSRMPLA
jgi:predicted transcriptional regulator